MDSLVDAEDIEILMHRDAHFGGKFSVMIEYYKGEGKGVNEAFQLPRIEELAELEEKIGENLGATLLSGVQAEEVGRARTAYKQLRELYNESVDPDHPAKLIADLVLAEDEAEKECAAVVKKGEMAVSSLIDLLQSEDFYQPLFPGYGKAPYFAAVCLGKIGDERAAPALFERLYRGDFFDEEVVIRALVALGSPGEDFLMRRLMSRPITKDHERAAMALSSFPANPKIAKAALDLLKEKGTLEKLSLAPYLIYLCEGLEGEEDKQVFTKLAKEASEELKLDFHVVLKAF